MNGQALYETAVREYGPALDRLAAGYEADPAKRDDLRQEIHFRLWRSLAAFDGRCSLRTWAFRVAHNTAVSWVRAQSRTRLRFLAIEEIEAAAPDIAPEIAIDRRRALDHLYRLIWRLAPLDRQIMLCYLEEMDNQAIAAVTGLAPAYIAIKIHRIKQTLARRFPKEHHHV